MAAEAVKVAVCCRPLSGREAALGRQAIVGVDSARGRCLVRDPAAPAEPPRQFFFDGRLVGSTAPSTSTTRSPTRWWRVSWKATMALSLPMARLAVGSPSPCRDLQILPHRKGSFPGHLNTSLRVYSVLRTPSSC